jgi:hypothetical protein
MFIAMLLGLQQHILLEILEVTPCILIVFPSCTPSLLDGYEQHELTKSCTDSRSDTVTDNGNPSPNAKRIVGCGEFLCLGQCQVQSWRFFSAAVTVWQPETMTLGLTSSSLFPVSTRHNYECISEVWCGMLGYGPREQGEILAWEKESLECSISLTEIFPRTH